MCILKIYSDTTSFENYSMSTDLPVVSCQDKGQLRKRSTEERYGTHRVSIAVSDKNGMTSKVKWQTLPNSLRNTK